jgi:hypothetical protein
VLLHSELTALFDEALDQTSFTRKGGTQLLYHCKCGHPKRKLEVNLDSLIFHCWVCDSKGTLTQLLNFFNTPRIYKDRYAALTKDIIYGNLPSSIPTKTEVALPNEFHPLFKIQNSIEYKNAISYLRNRGILKEDVFRYNIGYCETGEYAGYIIFPSYNAKGNLNFFIGRKYYNVKREISYKKPQVSMNMIGFESFINWNEPINLCEGVFDACAIRNNAIPLFGKYIQNKLLSTIIKKKVKRINIILDDDALEDAIKNYEKLKGINSELQIHIVKLDGKDPSVVGYDKIWKSIKSSTQFELKDLLLYKLKS